MKLNGSEILLNLLFWGLTGWLITSGFSIQSQEIQNINGVETIRIVRNETIIIKLLLCIGIAVILFYANLWNILRLYQQQNKTTTIFYSILILLCAFAIYYILERSNIPGPPFVLPASLITGILFFYFTCSISYGIGKIWLLADKQKQLLVIEKQHSELARLRNQLQPHFLFNALNNLLSLVDQKQSPLLADSIDKLSGLLRYIIDETAQYKVPVQKEINFIKNYAALQLLRFEKDEVVFNLEITGECTQQKIEPGIFLPFVENAFKYGAAPEQQTTINLWIDLSETNQLKFCISNHCFHSTSSPKGNGTGITSTKERLNLVYPGKHFLKITNNKLFQVDLTIITDESNHS